MRFTPSLHLVQSLDEKISLIFWLKFGLGLNFGLSHRLSERLIQKVKSPTKWT